MGSLGALSIPLQGLRGELALASRGLRPHAGPGMGYIFMLTQLQGCPDFPHTLPVAPLSSGSRGTPASANH
jgi:hypothetical protein